MALGMSVAECQRTVDSPEFVEWQHTYRDQLFPHERVEIAVARLASLVANVFRKKGAGPISPAEFMWQPEAESSNGESGNGDQPRPRRPAMSPAQQKNMLMAFANAQNAFIEQQQRRGKSDAGDKHTGDTVDGGDGPVRQGD